MPIIEVENLSREFQVMESAGRFRRRRKAVHAVRGIDFTVEPGEAVGYIGANGAGKSTTIKMLTGVLVPSSGRVTVCGFNPVPQRKALARKIGVVFGQRSQLWWDLPLQDSYPILGAMHRMSEADWRPRFRELADQMDLGEFLSTPVRQLSLGQRMRGEVAAALLHRPELVILDEPTIGLDMISKEKLRQFLDAERRENGTTLLLTTHDMSDIQRLCQRVLVVDDGVIAYDGPLTGLAEVAGAVRTMVVDLATPVHSAALFSLPDGAVHQSIEADGIRHSVSFDPRMLSAATVLAAISSAAEVADLSLHEPDIEHLVRQLYGSARR
ncbi:ABC-2 type transport system ATP-binding protein [Pseudarthrobacter sp. PvP004]|uniref:ABC transporter ATP-binding protein n=1 Tax=Pseudarthrobacter sp. PvP004 TaxID=2817850 RepID=UPI001AE7279B|nr:ATP-binding cassette domain-containing protein [Pseudarthrobacter sp. PvP004]MBP2268916.1 ABC-2 type transport system ATP-binding protein [Pseudarthrobacter sp. PvP004]